MKQAPGFDGLLFGPFSLSQNGLAAPEVDISRGEVLQAFVVSAVIVMADESADLPLEIAGQEVVFQKDSVLKGLMPSLDLALGLGMIGGTTNMIHSLVIEPICEFGGDVTGTVIRQQPRPMPDIDLITA